MTGLEDSLKFRAIGRGSLSSLLKILVDVSWVVACAALGFVWLIAILSAIVLLSGDTGLKGPLGEISIKDAHNLAGWTIAGTIINVGTMAISARLRGVFETLVIGDPFVPENATRFRRIALVLAILELSRVFVGPLISLILSFWGVASNPEHSNILARLASTNFVTWAAVLVLIVLAQIFDEGAQLREDQKMTI